MLLYFDEDEEISDEDFWWGNLATGCLDEGRLALQKALFDILEPPKKMLDLMCGSEGSYVPTDIGEVISPEGSLYRNKRLTIPEEFLYHTGADISEYDVARNRNILNYVILDVNDVSKQYSFPDESFDAVVMTWGIAYVREPNHMFSEVNRILRPKGTFVVGYDHHALQHKATKLWTSLNDEERLAYIQQLFHNNGFGDQKVKTLTEVCAKLNENGPRMEGINSTLYYLVHATKK